ncbi:Lysophospholipase L1 [Kytococcus aerolatus]|uniref:Lysophospholipase L1 n=1 Tax=Kytococcus aerolatus TaxID=592308 RepID=A0A212U7V3_9MICO|nr:SGNH/GDSL hydrolase family protein [Kytococcus aerolatus]SNC74329.1 Lysophospholipase L1 [Kytococcus aerolatus]
MNHWAQDAIGRGLRVASRVAAGAAQPAAVTVAGAGLLGVGTVGLQLWQASQLSDGSPGNAPDDQGVYGPGESAPWQLVVMGDSVANGIGAQRPGQTIGARCARRIAEVSGRPVHLHSTAVNSVTSLGLPEQVDRALAHFPQPDLVLLSIGGNDIAQFADRDACLAALSEAVRRLVGAGAEVVVATCPDFGMIASLGQPLRWLMQQRSRGYAAAQTVAVVEAGGRTVSLGSLITRAFLDDPDRMFHTDRFHPSAQGYQRAARVIVPSLLDALHLPVGERDRARAEGAVVETADRLSLSRAAIRAAAQEGTEVLGAGEDAQEQRRQGVGRLGALVRRRRQDPGDDADTAAPPRPVPFNHPEGM